ncbi:hypothetical protein Taro_021885, partial [Colocasia esculenta]|nr:hypothetical protein [Colocasia esculenta]
LSAVSEVKIKFADLLEGYCHKISVGSKHGKRSPLPPGHGWKMCRWCGQQQLVGVVACATVTVVAGLQQHHLATPMGGSGEGQVI